MAGRTVNEIVDDMGFGMFNCKVMGVIGMVWLMEGVEITLISLIAPRLKCEWNISSYETALMSSCVFIGMGIGSAGWGWLGDKLGRRRIMFASSFCLLCFALLTAAASNIFWFVFIRLLVGFGVGGISSAICYLVEFSTTPYRAKAVIATQFFFAFGNVFAAAISYLSMNSLGWRWFIVLCATPIPLTLILIPRLPESVRYLQNIGNHDVIMDVLHTMARDNKTALPKDVLFEAASSEQRGKVRALLNRTYCKQLLVLIILWIVSCWSYFGVILLNTEVLQNRKYQPASNVTTKCYELKDSDYLQNLLVVFGEIPGLVFFFFVIERVGRRKSLMLSFFLTSVCFFTLAFPLTPKQSTIMMFITRAGSTTLPQILYIFTTEIFPTTIRNTALGVCIAIARCFLAMLPFLVSILVKVSYVSLLAVLSVSAFACSLLCFILPETTGKELLNS